ncbi:MAG TPA: ribosome silencing factor [Polyangia bacterium]
MTKKKTPKPTVKTRTFVKPKAAAKKGTTGKRAVKGKGAGKATGKVRKPVARPVREAPPVLQAVRPGEERERRESLATAKAAVAAALDKKALEPVLIDVCGRASYADFIVVVSGRSDRQVDAIADGVCEGLATRGRRPMGREGARNGRWVLIDFGDVVVHVFYHPLREVFDIESLWIDAPRIKLQIPAEARADAAPGRDTFS